MSTPRRSKRLEGVPVEDQKAQNYAAVLEANQGNQVE